MNLRRIKLFVKIFNQTCQMHGAFVPGVSTNLGTTCA